MKRLLLIVLLPLALLTGCSHEKKEYSASELYQHYAERQNLKVAQVEQFSLSDSVSVEVILMEADDENAWQQLKEEFNIQGDEGTVSWLGDSDNPALRTQWTGIPVMRVIASLDKHTIGIYRIDNEMQYDAIVDYQFGDKSSYFIQPFEVMPEYSWITVILSICLFTLFTTTQV